MKLFSARLGLLVGLSTTFALQAPLVRAQDTLDEIDLLEEIVVTAQKREQNLQDVPIAVTALTDSFLADHKIESVQDMAGTVPGLVVTSNVGNGVAPISIRGIGGPSGGGSIFNDEPVGVYVDGVYIARAGASIQDLVDVDSIQVLRGPQGTLYGRNSTAGALLVTTKRPTQDFQTAVTAGYDSLNLLKVTGSLSGGFSDSVSARLALGYSDGGNFATNIVTGKKVGGAENQTARGSLRFAPNGDLTVDLIATYSKQISTPALYSVAALSGSSPAYAGNPFVVRPNFQQAIESDRVAMDDKTETTLKSTDLTSLINWDLGPASLYSITGYRKLNNDGTTDSDAQPNTSDYANATGALKSISTTRVLASGWDGLLRNSGHQVHKQWSEEVRLQSNGDNKFDWTVGLFYLHEDNLFDFFIENWQSRVPAAGNVPPGSPIPWGTRQTFYATQKVDAYALFSDVNYQLTDQWSVTVGARYSDEKKAVEIRQTPQDLFAGNIQASLGLAQFAASKKFNNFSPRAVINFKPNEDTLTYFNFSKGFKSGGYNSFDASAAASAFPEERINAYELGLKSDFADKRIRTNLSVFKYDYSNVQLRQAVFTGGVAIRTVPKAEVKGVELESTFALSRALTVNANVSWLDATLKEGQLNALQSNLNTLPSITYGAALAGAPGALINGVVVSQNVAGNRMARAPEWQGALNVEYKTAVTEGVDSRIGLTWRAQSKVYFSETNQDTEVFVGKGWNELDVRASVSDPDRVWEVAVIGANILDNRHLTQVTPFSGFPVGTVNLPARVGVQFSHKLK